MQYVFLLNPLVFMSEAMRLSVTPDVPHMPVPLLIGGLVAFSAFFLFSGARAFERENDPLGCRWPTPRSPAP